MLVENADEPYASKISTEIVATIKRGEKMETTTDLRLAIERALQFLLQKNGKSKGMAEIKKSCQRTFQAIRIDVNNEFEVLYEFLEKLPKIMSPGGKIAILTFHSGEDVLVKKAFKQGLREGIYSEVARNVIRPSAEECRMNGRAKSTKMRWAIKA